MQNFDFGPLVEQDGILFRFWAPKEEAVRIKLGQGHPMPMQRAEDGWFTLKVQQAKSGERYSFILGNELEVPDPASRSQPDDVHGQSEVVSPVYEWREKAWAGRPWEESVIYELHIGTFTAEGTFSAAVDKLDTLAELGVTVIQLMPVNDFTGARGWGYDGVLPYAPNAAYGRPEDLKAFIDAAHQRGLSVFLDVIYNHFGPDGNYLPIYAPLFTPAHRSPWGDGINYDGDGSHWIREFVIQNTLYWLTEFKADGLRFDAVHAIKDDSREHLLKEIARRARAATGNRHVHLIVENEENDSALLARDDGDRPSLYTAQWNDDIHHVLHIAATGETFGYYADFADDLPMKVGRALAEGFVYQGEHMPYRGSERGSSTKGLPPTAFVSFIQNHDQVGNRAYGDRISGSAPAAHLRATAAIYLLSPQIPMMFMGEEWAASTPFPYFCDFHKELNDIVRAGRRKELARLPGFDEESASKTPDPTTLQTFNSAKLDWSERQEGVHQEWLDFYKSLLNVRHREIMPRLQGVFKEPATFEVVKGAVAVLWTLPAGERLHLWANLSDQTVDLGEEPTGRHLWMLGEVTGLSIGPWSVLWTLEQA